MRWTPAESGHDATLTRAFARCLPGGRLGGPLQAYRSAESTQALARAWADAGAPEGAVVLADYQGAGRGRRGRSWTAPPGCALLLSLVLRPRLPVSRWPEIPLAAGCAVAEAVEAVAPVVVRLKWPNDVLVAGRKLAGILAEGVPGSSASVILGIGVNVSQRQGDWPADLAKSACSLASLGASVSRESVLTTLLARVAAWYGVLLDVGFEPVRAAWRRRGLLGTRIALAEGAGTSVGLGPGGQLVVRRDDGHLTLLVAPSERHAEESRAGSR
jgi:BirA family biotin operon repressor/biotin-[acetyl-CoA-carboxylase] ligase